MIPAHLPLSGAGLPTPPKPPTEGLQSRALSGTIFCVREFGDLRSLVSAWSETRAELGHARSNSVNF
jgi:hypothetical protein